ncbi:MAG: tetratricopeptide repeat protein [Gemmatimonadales bacterium]
MTTPGYQRFFAELKRRRVFRVMAVYGIVGFVLLQLVDLAVPALLLPEWTYRLVALFLLLGFPVAIVLAWALEMTPEGVRRTVEAAPGELTEIIAAPASKRWPAGVLALVGMTTLLAGVWYVGRQSAPAAAVDRVAEATPAAGPVSASIAVLPFVNMSSDPEQEFFSDGISEELLNLLAKIPELKVAARTSSFSFKDQNLEIPEIADRLNVAHVLEGSVRKADDQVRITAQLIRAEDGYHLWSDTWDRSLENIFAIQDEIAADVAEQLKVTLLGEAPTVAETDPEAYALYLQARQLNRQVTAEGLERSIELFQRALDIDPEYAAAWAGLAEGRSYEASFALRPIDEAYSLARDAASEALAIDPGSAEAHAQLGHVELLSNGDVAAAARHYEEAIRLAPTDTDILTEAVTMLRILGRLDEAIALQEYALARDPVNATGHFRLGLIYQFAGRLEEAIASTQTALDLSPGRISAQNLLATIYLLHGEPETALEAIRQESLEAWRLVGLVMVHHALGQPAESDAALSRLMEEYEEGWANNIAYALAYRGEADHAFEMLGKAVEYNDPGLTDMAIEPMFANIHDDPRWLPFLESVGRSPEQLAAIDFEVTLPK